MQGLRTPKFTSHHVTLSVRDLDASIAFYSELGFRPVLRWSSRAKDLQLAHLNLGGALLELFAYSSNSGCPRSELAVGNNLPEIGVRHFGLSVPNLAEARDFLRSRRHEVTEIKRGRTMIDFFYIKDPDGNWVEVVHDERPLSPDDVIELTDKPD